jgi:hypothetical protein
MADNSTKFVLQSRDSAIKKAGHRVAFKANDDTIHFSEFGIVENNNAGDSTLGPVDNGQQLKTTHYDDPWDGKLIPTLGERASILVPSLAALTLTRWRRNPRIFDAPDTRVAYEAHC